MRTLSGEFVVDAFIPARKVLLDGQDTGVNIAVTVMSDMVALHGNGAETYIIDAAIRELDLQYKLTEDEKEHFATNFRSLVGV